MNFNWFYFANYKTLLGIHYYLNKAYSKYLNKDSLMEDCLVYFELIVHSSLN